MFHPAYTARRDTIYPRGILRYFTLYVATDTWTDRQAVPGSDGFVCISIDLVLIVTHVQLLIRVE